MKKFLLLFLLYSLFSYSQVQTDYSQGIFFVNEDWFGHSNGSVNFLSKEGKFTYRAYSKENNGETFGVTTQYGTIYGDKFYFISKQEDRLVIADAHSLKKIISFENLNGGDGRSFVGVDENTGYIGTSNSIVLFDIKNLKIGNRINGTEKSGQIGNMARNSKYVFAVKKEVGILIIDPTMHSVIKTIPGSYNTLTQSMDGNIWIGTDKKLLKLDSQTLEIEDEIPLNSSSAITGSWGAWDAGSFCSSTHENMLYWINGSKIIRYDIDTKTLDSKFATLPGQDSKPKQVIYGAGLRVDPVSGNLVLTTRQAGWGINYQYNWVHILSKEGILLNTYKLDDYYWFPAMPVFPDVYAPEVSKDLPTQLNLKEEYSINLKNLVTDKDNFNSSIVKTINSIGNNHIVKAIIDKDENLIITPLNMGTTNIELKFTSNGKIYLHKIDITIPSYSLEVSKDLPTQLNLKEEYSINLKNLVTNKDNSNSSIIKSINSIGNNHIVKAIIDKDENLIITPLQKGTTDIELKFTSNGKIYLHKIDITISLETKEKEETTFYSTPYPNPFNQSLFIDTKEKNSFSIFTINGVKVYTGVLKEGKNEINTSFLQSGIYLIKLNNKVTKMIKQ